MVRNAGFQYFLCLYVDSLLPCFDEIKKKWLSRYICPQGVKNSSVAIGLEDKVTIDLVVTGCVAVSSKGKCLFLAFSWCEPAKANSVVLFAKASSTPFVLVGWRIGKGEGYADLEWAMMRCMEAVSADTMVVTTVHDCQVIDDMPDALFQPHDLTVDIIVTPTRVIQCEKQQKPEGIYWNQLTKQRLHDIPVLKKLRAIEEKAGKDVTLQPMPERALNDGGDMRGSNQAVENGEEQSSPKRERRRRPPRRGARHSRGDSESGRQSDAEERNLEGDGSPQRERRERPNRRRQPLGDTFSIFVGSIPRSCRVSTFKTAIREKGVSPLRVIWHGGNGHAFLQFEKSDEMEDAMQKLAGLEIRDRELRIELSNRTKQKNEPGNQGDKPDQESSPNDSTLSSPKNEPRENATESN